MLLKNKNVSCKKEGVSSSNIFPLLMFLNLLVIRKLGFLSRVLRDGARCFNISSLCVAQSYIYISKEKWPTM